MSERLNVSLSKSDKVKAFGGSNPPLCATKFKLIWDLNPRGQPLSGGPQQVAPFATLKFAHWGKFFNAAHPLSAPASKLSLLRICYSQMLACCSIFP